MAEKKFNWRSKPADHLNAKTIAKYERLEKTSSGLALIELLELCGGPTALARALNANVRTVNIWCHRGQVGVQGAYLVEELPFFTEKGWTKERVRPDLLEHQWPGFRHDFSGFLGATKEEIEISRKRHEKRLADRQQSKLEREIEIHKELLARVNGETDEQA